MNIPNRTINMADLAKIAGVSVSTVSRALAGNEAITSDTRERISRLAQEHGYRPNMQARNLRLRRSQSIGVVLPLGHQKDQHLTDPFFLMMLGHLADAISDKGYDMLLSKVIPTDELWLDRLIDSGRIDGLIIVGQSNQTETIERVSKRFAPMVVWGACMPGQNHISVGTDNRLGARLITEHLIGQGRRRLMFLGDPSAPEIKQREIGFHDACAAAGDDVFVTTMAIDLVAENAYTELSKFFDEPAEIDGIVAATDVIAMSAIRALSDHGLNVPSDVAVTGFDDVALASHTIPPLTTVKQDLEAGARIMIEKLFGLLDGKTTGSLEMKPKIIMRGSA
ncbi:LacI family DNA-binding transcriptional regulator [Sphingorhabdus arenilitoris]|uniref:LacI family DNA-binding transcriptional regulator n=1 Tax=Sphingorhabdus arenilitoris TaxID=1490041 RepID=A0ABV8RGS5_9SPHN